VAFARGDGVVAVVPRLTRRWADGWDATTLELPDGPWRDAVSGARWRGRVPLEDLLSAWPMALLEAAR
jgi:(1->4)-alpha-D-glucan 1-alpha-D-glucosylmutase